LPQGSNPNKLAEELIKKLDEKRNKQTLEKVPLQHPSTLSEEETVFRHGEPTNENIDKLQKELSGVRAQAKGAMDMSSENKDLLGQATNIGRLIGGAVVFLLGVIVTQAITKFMTRRDGHV
jgi:hypothetical protein